MDRNYRRLTNSTSLKTPFKVGPPSKRQGANGDQIIADVNGEIRFYRKELNKWYYAVLNEKSSAASGIASVNNLGLIKVGAGLSITNTGVLSAPVGANYYLDGITQSGNTLTFSVNGTSDQSFTFGSNAFTSYTDHSTQGYLTGNELITFTGDVTGSGTTSVALTIGANKVTLAKMQTIATDSFLGRDTASTGNVEVLSLATVKTMFGTGNNALVPSLGVSTQFLAYDGAFATPPTVSTSDPGYAPALPSPHGGKFLRGDGTWVVPPDTDTIYTDWNLYVGGVAKDDVTSGVNVNFALPTSIPSPSDADGSGLTITHSSGGAPTLETVTFTDRNVFNSLSKPVSDKIPYYNYIDGSTDTVGWVTIGSGLSFTGGTLDTQAVTVLRFTDLQADGDIPSTYRSATTASDDIYFKGGNHITTSSSQTGSVVTITFDVDDASVNADTVDSLHASSFLRSDAADSFSGKLTWTQGATVGIDMANGNIANVNNLTFNDPGVDEGLEWVGGNGWKIYESPNGLTNAAGNLQFVTTSTRRMTLDTSGNLDVTGDLTVDTTTLKVDSANNRVGILTASPRGIFDVDASSSDTAYISTYPDYNIKFAGGDRIGAVRDSGAASTLYIQHSLEGGGDTTFGGTTKISNSAPELQLIDTDFSRYGKVYYGTRAFIFDNVMNNETLSSVAPWFEWRFATATSGTYTTALKIDYDLHATFGGNITAGGLTWDGTNLTAESANDAPIITKSTDGTTGIQFKDSNSTAGRIYYVGSSNYFYMNNSAELRLRDAGGATDITLDPDGKSIFANELQTSDKLTCDTITGLATNFDISQSTTDGVDAGRTRVNGGGAAGDTRGGYIELHGNEHSNTGQIRLLAGNVTGGEIRLYTSGLERFTVEKGGTTVINASLVSKVTGNGDVGLRIQRASASGRAQYTLENESGTQLWRCGLTGGGSTTYGFWNTTVNVLELSYSNNSAKFGGTVKIDTDNSYLTFGTAGNGSNVNGRWLSIEGNCDTSGEGSGRIFFAEHNSTTASMSNYGMSIGYRGGDTSIVGADGNTWTGLSQIANGSWGMWGHDNNATGSLIMYGTRAATSLNIVPNTIFAGTVTWDTSAQAQFEDNGGNVRGYIGAGNLDDKHLAIATTSGEDIGFLDGGIGGTLNAVVRGNGDFWVLNEVLCDMLRFHDQPNVRMDGSAERGELMALYNTTGTNAYVGFELRGKANGANDATYPKWSVMALSVCGMYDDTNNKWGMLCRPNAEVELYYNAAVKLETTSTGILINGGVPAIDFGTTAKIDITGTYAEFDLDSGKIGYLSYSNSARLQWNSSGVIIQNGTFTANSSATFEGDVTIQNSGDATLWIRADMDNVTETDNATLRISQDGELVNFYIGTDSNNGCYFQAYDYFAWKNSGGTERMRLTSAGELRCDADVIAYYSDARLKDFHGVIKNPIEKIMKLNGYYFTENSKAKELGFDNDRMQVGVSAQEIEEVLPELIKDAPIGYGYKTIDYGKITPLLIEAIKEQQKQINELKRQIGEA